MSCEIIILYFQCFFLFFFQDCLFGSNNAFEFDTTSMFSEPLWTDTISSTLGSSSYFSGGFRFSSSPLMKSEMPTPPHSPSGGACDLFGDDFDSSFNYNDLVNPNSVLDVFHPASNSPPSSITNDSCKSSDWLLGDSNFPADLSDIDVKMEPLEPYLGDFKSDITANSPFCVHDSLDFDDGFCHKCIDEAFKTEIVNDCMWTSGTAVDPEVKSTNSSLVSVCPNEGGALPPRTHLDSTASNFSDFTDQLNGDVIAPLQVMEEDDGDGNSSISPPPPRIPVLETPSESSDTDTDFEEQSKHPHVQSVQLDHNYHITKGSIANPLFRALHKVSVAQTDSGKILFFLYPSSPSL